MNAVMLTKTLIPLVCLTVTVLAQQSRLMPDYFDHPCVRTCTDEADPMECQYRFVVESYQTMSKACYGCAAGNTSDCRRAHCVTANGFSRNIKTVNRQIPGPTIQVCEGDTIIVDLENYYAMSEGVTIHWHGILQRFSPHMDGVGMITQCPIQAFTTFQYRFVAIDPGTHFWHAHTGLQRGEGMFGSLVVRQPPSREPHIDDYDFDLPEHVFIVNEWQNKPLVEIYTSFHHGDGQQAADAVLINGRAKDSTDAVNLPRTVFDVEPGQRYRFRVINSGSLFCPIEISVDNHNLTLIASDGRAFESFVVQSFDTYSAERYDFIVTTDQPVDNYWIRARGLGTCEANSLTELAVLRYGSDNLQQAAENEEPPQSEAPEVTGVRFNSIPVKRTEPLGDARDQVLSMNAVAPDDRSLTAEPDHQFIMNFEMREVDNLHYFDPDLYPAGSGPYSSIVSAQISRISNRLGPVPLLAQMDQIPQEMFCNESSVGPRCETEWCECLHKLTVQQDQVVEMVFISPSGAGFTHPIHLHGFSFRVVGMERTEEPVMSPELFREMDARGDIPRKLSQAPFKDTIALPNGGYVIIRFVADNPGVWFAHCHLAFHAEIGMSFSLEVLGEDEQLPPPPENFPTCGPFAVPAQRLTSKQGTAQTESGSPVLRGTQSGSGPASDTVPQAAVPQWVLPLVVSMSVVIASLAVVVAVLWKKNKKTDRLEQSTGFTNYTESREITREETGEGNDHHFTFSKKQEKVRLTK